MAVIITNMEMPSNCGDCKLGSICQKGYGYQKSSDCPLKEVPMGKCNDCKWWKESDGTYKRGVRAESKCPINTKTVYLGEGYCYKFEPKMVEEQQGEEYI